MSIEAPTHDMALSHTTRSPVINLRMPPALLRRVDEYGAGRYLGRAETIRQLISAALEGRPDVAA